MTQNNLRIDAHQHFWNYDPLRDTWISEEMYRLQRDFLPEDLRPLLSAAGMDGSVLIQSEQSVEGNSLMLSFARDNDYIKGIIGWVDLRSAKLNEQLDYYRQFPVIKGFRHILQGEANRKLMLEGSFLKGIKALEQHSYTYDILIYKDQLKYIPAFIKDFPDQKFVLDHLAKPDIRRLETGEWERDIRTLSSFENLYCKISGMFFEADWVNWKAADFKPYLDIALEVFGPERLMYGSDWPVCLVAVTYEKQLEVLENYFSALSNDEQRAFFGGNAKRFYDL